MIRQDCFYYTIRITNSKHKYEPQCRNHIEGFCPCDTCVDYISREEMRRQIDILKRIRKESDDEKVFF